jgi:phosphoheptose isomerase
LITNGLLEHRDQVTRALGVLGSTSCERLVELLARCRRDGRRVAVAGNGGSAATAGHLVTDWSRQGGLRMLDLGACTPLVTALGNDEGFDSIFADTVKRDLASSDVLILLSTSGQSPNLLRAAVAARVKGVTVVALTGRPESPLGGLADIELCVEVNVPEVAEDVHSAIGHAVARELRRCRNAEQLAAADANGHRPGAGADTALAGPRR